jgi:hypothetical protein
MNATTAAWSPPSSACAAMARSRSTPSGSFTFAKRGASRFPNRRDRLIRGSEAISYSGRFSASGESVTGTISVALDSRTRKCSSGAVPYTLYLDGTAGAPFRNGVVATGTYVVSTSRGIRFRRPTRAFAPAEEVSHFRLTWRAPCRAGGSISFHEHLSRIPLVGGRARDTIARSSASPGRSSAATGCAGGCASFLQLRLQRGRALERIGTPAWPARIDLLPPSQRELCRLVRGRAREHLLSPPAVQGPSRRSGARRDSSFGR